MKRLFMAGVAAMLLLTAACSDDDGRSDASSVTDAVADVSTTVGSASNTDSTATTDAAGPAASSAPDTDAPQPASGEPIRLGSITSQFNVPAVKAGAEAAIAAINASGGVSGRPLEIEVCDNESDPNKAAECARRLASDDATVAAVGIISNYGGETNPVLEEAGLAGIGTTTSASGDFDSPVVFPASGGSLATAIGSSAALYDKLGSTEQGLLMIDTPGGVAFEGLINDNVLVPRGTKTAATAVIPLTAADVAPQAAAIASTDGAVVALTPDLAVRFVLAARQQGYEGPLVVAASQLSASRAEESLSGFTDELYAVGTFNFDSPGWARMLDEAEANGADPTLINDTFANAWLSVQIFTHVASQLETIDRESILAGMNELSDFDTEGLTAEPLDFTITGDALGGQAPRVIPAIQYAFLYRYTDGQYVPVDDKPQPLFAPPA